MNNSLKSKVKLWVSFLRLAHQSQDPEIQKNLNNNQSFYSDWGNYQSGSFDNWWKFHSYLFKEQSKLKVLMAGDVVEDGMFTIQFPFAYAPTTASKIFKDMFQRAFEAQRTDKKKVKKVYGGSFELKPDDFQVSQFQYYLKFCKEVYLPLMGKPAKPKTKEFVDLCVDLKEEPSELFLDSQTLTLKYPDGGWVRTNQPSEDLPIDFTSYCDFLDTWQIDCIDDTLLKDLERMCKLNMDGEVIFGNDDAGLAEFCTHPKYI